MPRHDRHRRRKHSSRQRDPHQRPTSSGPLTQRLGRFFPAQNVPVLQGFSPPAAENAPPKPSRPKIPDGWWEAAFANEPTPSERRGHKCGEHQMFTVVAYDITDERRLRKIAKICEDYGVRVQYSVFECRLEAGRFDQFWSDLLGTIDPATDRVVAYKVCTACAKDIRDAGIQTHQQKVVAYVF
jgi:CRISPR-associated protein Cas2